MSFNTSASEIACEWCKKNDKNICIVNDLFSNDVARSLLMHTDNNKCDENDVASNNQPTVKMQKKTEKQLTRKRKKASAVAWKKETNLQEIPKANKYNSCSRQPLSFTALLVKKNFFQ